MTANIKRFNDKSNAYGFMSRSKKTQWLAMDGKSFIVASPAVIDKLVVEGSAVYVK